MKFQKRFFPMALFGNLIAFISGMLGFWLASFYSNNFQIKVVEYGNIYKWSMMLMAGFLSVAVVEVLHGFKR